MAESNNFLQPSIPKFDGYYDHWAMLMENLLRSKEFWHLIETGVTIAPANATAEQRAAAHTSSLNDLKVKNYLFQSIDRSIMETIITRDTSKEIWDSMKRKYQGSSKVKRAQLQALRREFEVLCMKETETVDEFFARTLAIANKMTAQGEKLEQLHIVEKVLRSMTPRFNYVVCSIEESNDVTELTIDALQSSLLVHEQRMKAQKDKEEEQALKITSNGRGNGGNGGSRGRGRGGRGRGRGRQNKELVECFKCHKLGHYRNECPTWEEYDANYAEFDEEQELLLMARDNVSTHAKEEVWFLDSGCSNHMIGTKEWLFDYDDSFRESVKLGDDSRMSVMGRGNLKLQICGITQVITNVYFLPGLKNNLLSIGQLQQKDVTIVFKDDLCKVFHEQRGLIMTTRMTANRMYVISAPVILPMCLKTEKQVNSHLWHCRYGHLSFKGLNTLVKRNMVKGLPQRQEIETNCSDCMIGKQHRDSIPKQANWRATKKLELVHSDICGPINPTSNGGNRYFMTLTDDYSRKTWTYVMSEKSNAFNVFKTFKALVENESGYKIVCLRTDRGGEFTSEIFNNFCSENGIKRQLTTAYTPQQNGVSERKNRTLLNMVRSMLAGRNVPKKFWPEAVKWATYVLNRSPTLSVKDSTPEEAWSGLKPSVHHFKIFGCLAYVHVPDAKRTKLNAKSLKCVHLGVSEESKAYKLYDPVNKKIIVSRDVVFEEGTEWNWNDKKKAAASSSNNNDLISDETDIEEEAKNGVNTGNNESSSEYDSEQEGNDYETEEELPPRPKKKPGYLNDYVTGLTDEEQEQMNNLAVFSTNGDPTTYDEAHKQEVWRKAMDQEIESIENNKTWKLTSLPQGAKTIGVKWIYKTKYNEKGEVEKYKARLVAKGYSQQYGIDYNEVFAPVARWDTIRTLLCIAASKGWEVHQLDVKSAFLHGELTEDVYVEQPLGYQTTEKDKVYKLQKALYGLKQAPRAWYSKIESYFCQEKFDKCQNEHTLFVKQDGDKILIVSLYVDDLIYTGNDKMLFEEFKISMKRNFAMTDLGKMKYFLGVEVSQKDYGILIHQQKYAKELLSRFGMESCNTVNSPIVPGNKLNKDEGGTVVNATKYKQMVGSLMYLLATRPDLAYSVCLIARYMEKPTELHMAAAKRILRYLKGTLKCGVLYKRGVSLELQGWSDSDYAGDSDDRKSTSGYVFKLGSSAVSWSSKKQPIVTLSTTEAEFVAAAACACQGIWLRKILSQLRHEQKRTTIFCDNSSTIKLSKNPVMHGRCKHIDVRYYFLRDLIKDEIMELSHCGTEEQIADVMTKALKLESFCKFRKMLGVVDTKELGC
ncbi:unnamed protein product [Trifolium pratense]|uniref:Uncharacterized protein n=1 Tax=Trifolium pratense TaxID=57577 RepID=A0ACB0L9H5_TRIPR|nr:unnamed protein product [Trifolium pratense]